VLSENCIALSRANRDVRHRGCSRARTVAVRRRRQKTISRTTKAVNYRRAGCAKIDFQGTELMQQATAKPESRTRAAARKSMQNSSARRSDQVRPRVSNVRSLGCFSGSRAVNLGEVVLKERRRRSQSHLRHADLWLIVTAEPYFAVTQPGNTVVLENVSARHARQSRKTSTPVTNSSRRGSYSSSNTKIENGHLLASTAKRRSSFFERATPCASRISR